MIKSDSDLVGKKVELIGSMGHWGIVQQNADNQGEFTVALSGDTTQTFKAKSQDLALL